jgi:Fe-S cluster assembly protein SufD
VTTALTFDKALQATQASNAPEWFKQRQQIAANEFAQTQWPTRKTEAWKYTPLKSLVGIDWTAESADSSFAGVEFDEWDVVRLNVVNGELKSADTLPEGVELITLLDVNETVAREFFDRIDAYDHEFHFDSLNRALSKNAYWLKVAANAQVKKPIQINYVVSGQAQIASSQVLIDVAANAKCTVVETYSAEPDASVFVNGHTHLQLAENAHLTHYHLLMEEGQNWHLGRVSADLNRFANLTSFHMAIGGVVKRKDIVVRHKGEGAELSLNGVYLPRGQEIIDYHTCIEHEVPNCTSEEIFRGIIGDSAKAVFNGRIHIHKDAQKSLAEMNNRNLLLSDRAEIDTKPELEIYADDVKCAHGATIAQLDEKQLFYFQSRGISKSEAEVMLSFGFINELLDALPDEPVQNLLRPMLASLFAASRSELARHII